MNINNILNRIRGNNKEFTDSLLEKLTNLYDLGWRLYSKMSLLPLKIYLLF